MAERKLTEKELSKIWEDAVLICRDSGEAHMPVSLTIDCIDAWRILYPDRPPMGYEDVEPITLVENDYFIVTKNLKPPRDKSNVNDFYFKVLIIDNNIAEVEAYDMHDREISLKLFNLNEYKIQKLTPKQLKLYQSSFVI